MTYDILEFYHQYLHGISEAFEDVLTDQVIQPGAEKESTQGQKKMLNSNQILNENNKKADESVQRETRISLTIRHVPKTKHIKIKL